MQRNKVYVFDISNMIHRAFHVNVDMQTSYGFPTGAIYGTLRMMLSFIDKYKPTHILICYDAQTAKSVRKDIYGQYKSNRVQVNAVSAEEKIIRRCFEFLRLPAIEMEGYEADDLVAVSVSKLVDEMDIVIVTGDKDLLQLIRPGVQVFDSMKNIWYGPEEAMRKFGVRPEQISDYLAIVGDNVDNVPGVMGIGPKGAEKLLKSFNTVEDIYANLDKVDEKLRKKLEDGKDMALLSKKLTVLFSDLDIDLNKDFVKFKPVSDSDIYPLLEKLEIKSLHSHLEKLWKTYK